jgi:hypothetical protein
MMASPAAWYPDPGGQAGMFRYWDGAQWSTVLSSSPTAPPPGSPGGVDPTRPITLSGTGASLGLAGSGVAGPGAGAAGPSADQTPPSPPPWNAAPYGQNPYAATPYTTPYDPGQQKRRSAAPWVIAIAIVVAVGLIVWLAITQFTGSGGAGATEPAVVNPTEQVCPTRSIEWTPVPRPNDGRVYGGQLSYPMLGDPWGLPDTDEIRVPFGIDVHEQLILVHENPNPQTWDDWQHWVASVLVAGLNAGDGFYSPQEGSQIVVQCILGKFYGENTVVTPDVQRDEAFTLDGHDGWIVETNLSFSLPNLPTTSELAIVIIVQTSLEMSSIFYASIPNDAVQYMPDVEQAMAGLRVES